MNPYNPYAAPTAETHPHSQAPVIVQGEPQPWEIGEVLRAAWDAYKANWVPLTFGYFIVAWLAGLPRLVAPALVVLGELEQGTLAYFAVHFPLSFVGLLIAEFFAAGFVRASLRAVRMNSATIGDFFSAGDRFLPFVGMSFLRIVVTLLSAVMLVVPGVIVYLGLFNAPYFVVEQNRGPIDALKASWHSTEGHKVQLLAYSFVELALVLLGFVACCLGFWVVVPILTLGRAILYMRMSGTVPPAPGGDTSAPGAGAGMPYAPGSYGAWGSPGGAGGGGPVFPGPHGSGGSAL